jgi:hypothetical protein
LLDGLLSDTERLIQDVAGASRTATTISGDPGTSTNAIFKLNGNNRFSNFSVTSN